MYNLVIVHNTKMIYVELKAQHDGMLNFPLQGNEEP